MKREFKKILFVLLLTLSVFVLAACSKDEPEPDNKVTTTPEATTVPEPTQETSPESTAGPTAEPTAEPTPVVTEALVITSAAEDNSSDKDDINSGSGDVVPSGDPVDIPTDTPTETPEVTPIEIPDLVINENEAIAGYYKIASYDYDTPDFSINDMLAFFESKGIYLGCLIVDGNGKAVLTMMGTDSENLSYDDTCFFDDEEKERIPYKFEGDTITLTEDGDDALSMSFKKMTPEEIELFKQPIDEATYEAALLEYIQIERGGTSGIDPIVEPVDPTPTPVDTNYTNEEMLGTYKLNKIVLGGAEPYPVEILAEFEKKGIFLYALVVEPNGKATMRGLDTSGVTEYTLAYNEKYFIAEEDDAEPYTFDGNSIIIYDAEDPDYNCLSFVKMTPEEEKMLETPYDAELVTQILTEYYASQYGVE